MNQPLISIIIPVYNLEKYIEECLNSILLQTYQNFEVIIVDDGSIDSSLSICNSYSLKDKRVKVFKQKHLGSGNAKNFGIKQTTGEYITFIDGDDLIEKNYLEVLVSNIDDEIVSLNYFLFYKDEKSNKQFSRRKGRNRDIIIPHKDILKTYFLESTFMSPWCKLIPKKFFNDLSFKDGILEDVELMYKILLKAKYLVVSNKAHYFYRIRKGSTMHSNDEKKYHDMAKTTFDIFDQLKKQKVASSVYRYFYAWQIQYLFLYYLRTSYNQNNKKELSKISRYLRLHFLRYFFSKITFKSRFKLILNFFTPSLLRYISIKKQQHIALKN